MGWRSGTETAMRIMQALIRQQRAALARELEIGVTAGVGRK